MPIHCPVSVSRLETADFGKLDYRVMAHAFASHRDMGRLAGEAIYQGDLSARLECAGFAVHREVPITASFRTFAKDYYIDLVVNEQAVYELKTVAQLTAEHAGQLMNYLLMLDCSRGKLINFRAKSVQSQFVNAPITTEKRRQFSVVSTRWRGECTVRDCIVDMLRDWGCALELPLYHQCLVHLLGGEAAVTKQLPLQRDGIPLGNQRFDLMEPDAAFRLTAFNKGAECYEPQLQRLLRLSPLKAIHWINIALELVTFTTIH